MVYVDVINSTSPYPQAAQGAVGAPAVTSGARAGTQTLGFFRKTNAFTGALENSSFSGDVAVSSIETHL